MGKENSSTIAFNRGIISPLGLARIDLNRYKMSAETQTNWMPRVLGSMMLRPGMGYQNQTNSNLRARYIPFIFSSTQMYLIECTDSVLRFFSVNSATGDLTLLTQQTPPLGTPPLVSITNPNFDTTLAGWTNADEAGATSAWATGGYMSLLGTGSNSAIRKQTVAVYAPNAGFAYRLRIVIKRGPVTFRAGSADNLSDCFKESQLDTGVHSLVMTNYTAAGLFLKFSNAMTTAALVDSVNIEAPVGTTLSLPSVFTNVLLDSLRWTQSGDIVYIATGSTIQKKIERRQNDSWSLTDYTSNNGPFKLINTGPITLTPSATTGDITLTASAALFDPLHVGALFRISSVGQYVTATLGGANQFSNPILVTGVSVGRSFSIIISGVFVATVTLQYSVGAPGSWVDKASYTVPTSTSVNDGYDNQLIYYRIGIKAGDYTSGSAVVQLVFAAGSITGVARITNVANSTTASAAVLSPLGGTTASVFWYEGEWSDYRGWPSATTIHEGRLWWAGKAKIWSSVSDSYYNFDDNTLGDSAPISRTIGEGPVDTINWLLTLTRLLMGTQSNSGNIPPVTVDGNSVLAARSSSLDEPLTTTNFNLKKIASSALFVDRSLRRIYEAAFDPKTYDYATNDLNIVSPDLHTAGIGRIAMQMKPDARLHVVRNDGTVAVLVFDKAENVTCWIEVETQGTIEEVVTLPGTEEDFVYYQVMRTINGASVRTIEKWAKESECSGFPVNKQGDAFLYMSNGASPTTSFSTASLYQSGSVIAWGWNTVNPFTVTMPDGTIKTVGRYLGVITVNSGNITLPINCTDVVVGLPYTAQFKSLKQAFAAAMGTPLNQTARINALGVVLANTHCQALQYGRNFDNLDHMPLVENGFDLDPNTIWSQYDNQAFEFPGDWDTDVRLCLQAVAPLPCTVLAATVTMQKNDKG